MGYYLDATAGAFAPYPDLGNAGILNAAYIVARRGFFSDLSPWADEMPSDDSGQPRDPTGRCRGEILRAANTLNGTDAIIRISGFPPWWRKYCRYPSGGGWVENGAHGAVETEWGYAAVASAHNAVMDADAYGLIGLANASFHRHFTLASRYEQDKPPPPFCGLISERPLLFRQREVLEPCAFLLA